MSNLRQLFSHTVGAPGINTLAARLLPPWATVFMLHRLAVPELGLRGLEPDYLRRCLQYLRRHNYSLLALDEAVARSLDGTLPRGNHVVFTLDDGCFEQVDLAARVFAEFDCPSTCFLISGYLDGQLWPWDYQLVHLHSRIAPPRLTLAIGEHRASLDGESDWAGRLIWLIRRHAPQDAERIVQDLYAQLGETIPAAPPPELAPASWHQVRAAERLGMRFGAHTVSHRNLFGTSVERIKKEIDDSIERVEAECASPSRVFCYPSGKLGDFDDRAITVVQRRGMLAAVSAEAGFVQPARIADESRYRFVLPRMTVAERFSDFTLSLSWAQYLREQFAANPLQRFY